MANILEDLITQVDRLQRQVDALKRPEVGRWKSWTPTVTQGVAVTVTVDYARYFSLGKLVFLLAHLTVTSAGTGGTVITIGGLPLTNINSTGNSKTSGTFGLRDASIPTNYTGSVHGGATTLAMRTDNTAGSGIGQIPNLALASGDTIGFTLAYER